MPKSATPTRRSAARDPLDHDPAALRDRRIECGLRQGELAEQVSVSAGHMSELERGTRNPSPALLVRLADALDCEVADLRPRPARPAVRRGPRRRAA